MIVFPKAIGKSAFVSWKRFELSILSIETILAVLFGTSIPIVPFPGMGAMIRMPRADKLKAISSSRFLILLIRTPGAGVTSYKVIVGPMVAVIAEMSTPKLFRTLIILFLFPCCSSISILGPLSE